jgi:hypothetical protein
VAPRVAGPPGWRFELPVPVPSGSQPQPAGSRHDFDHPTKIVTPIPIPTASLRPFDGEHRNRPRRGRIEKPGVQTPGNMDTRKHQPRRG